jgi:hypothetical protein
MELWVTLVCAPLFLLCELAQRRRRFALAIPVLMIAAQLTIEVWLRPRIATVARGGEAFALLHGAAAMLYLAASLLGVWLVLARPPAAGSVRAP